MHGTGGLYAGDPTLGTAWPTLGQATRYVDLVRKASALAHIAVDTIRSRLLHSPPGVSREEIERYFQLEENGLLRDWTQALAALLAEQAADPGGAARQARRRR